MGIKNSLTSRHKRYWKNRKIDWEQAYWNPDHPHRHRIIQALSGAKFNSLVEIGCASGANLHSIKKAFPHIEYGGVDISRDAIETAKKLLPDAAVLEVSDATKVFLSDKSVDVILSDMCLIYMDYWNIDKALSEMKRIGRKHIFLCELHHKNWFKRLALKIFSGYNAYNYTKLLKKHGFYDIEFYKLTEEDWPGGNPQKDYGYIITAKI